MAPSGSSSSGFGRYEWAKRTGGCLTCRQRARFIPTIWGAIPEFVFHRFLRRTPPAKYRQYRSEQLTPPAPNPEVARIGHVEAHRLQSAAMANHGFRTWTFGYALSVLDGKSSRLDPDLFYLACLFHDSGLMSAVADECFTLRSAGNVAAVASKTSRRSTSDVAELQDAVVDHLTPGITKRDVDRLTAVYVQQGTLADLTGHRITSLPKAFVSTTIEQYPRLGLGREVCGRWRRDADAVPTGRTQLLERWSLISWVFAHPPRSLTQDSTEPSPIKPRD